ncbi:Uncharacterised protein [Mycobacterium tuberculosis]|nr:Uncharacterised protein [Mycobacterium tuberculosis]
MHTGGVAGLWDSRMCRCSSRARQLRHAVAARRQPTAARPDRRRHGGAARWPTCPPVPAAAGTAAARVRAARRPRRCSAAAGAPPERDLGTRMRIRPGDGGRLRHRGGQSLHGRRPVAARRHRAGPAGGENRCGRLRSRLAGQLPGVVTEIRLPRARRLPRLPHLRPPDRTQTGQGHRA